MLISTSQLGLNNSLDKLSDFCSGWDVELNYKKSQVIIFNTTGRVLRGYTFTYRGKPLQIVKTYFYLGIDFFSSRSFPIGHSNAEKARKAMSPLLSIIPDSQICKKSLGLFNSFIRPITLYNLENITHLTHRQMEAIKINLLT